MLKKKFILENFTQKKGKKHKSETLIKKTIKNIQKLKKKENSISLLKRAIVLVAEVHYTGKQTIKRGKRKRKTFTNIILASEKARFNRACRNFIDNSNSKVKHNFIKKISSTIEILNKKKRPLVEFSKHEFDKKLALKFKK